VRFIRALLFLSLATAAEAQGTGSVDGSVTLSRALAARRVRFRIYSDPGKGSTPPSQPAPELKDEYPNVVVYLERNDALSNAPDRHPQRPTMRQHDERFIPHVLPILRGTTVDFPNDDDDDVLLHVVELFPQLAAGGGDQRRIELLGPVVGHRGAHARVLSDEGGGVLEGREVALLVDDERVLRARQLVGDDVAGGLAGADAERDERGGDEHRGERRAEPRQLRCEPLRGKATPEAVEHRQ
jgi:hypothetical protein